MSDKDFKLKSSSEGFDTRTKDIFANIDSLASTSKKQQNSEEQKQPRKRITAPSPPPEDKWVNYLPQWWVELDDELSWLFTNRLSATYQVNEI